jgi:hypothetical protein
MFYVVVESRYWAKGGFNLNGMRVRQVSEFPFTQSFGLQVCHAA